MSLEALLISNANEGLLCQYNSSSWWCDFNIASSTASSVLLPAASYRQIKFRFYRR